MRRTLQGSRHFFMAVGLALAMVGMAAQGHASTTDWTDLTTISNTMGLTQNKVCIGGTDTDIGCPTYAPSVAANGTLTATAFVGDGSGLTGVVASTGDRIVSNTTSMIADGTSGLISITQAGTNTAYFHPQLGLVAVGVSTTGIISTSGLVSYGSISLYNGNIIIPNTFNLFFGNSNDGINGSASSHYLAFKTSNTEAMRIVSTGYVGIGTTAPSYTLHVNGYVLASSGLLIQRRSDNSNGLVLSGNAGLPILNITGMSSNNNVNTMVFRNSGGSIIAGFGDNSNSPSLIIGNLASATNIASATLHVSGTIKMSDGGESCDANRTGAIKYSGGDFSVCRNGSSWESLTSITNAANSDRISSGTTSVVANQTSGLISITQAGTNTAYFHPSLGLVTVGVSSTGPVSATDGYFTGNITAQTGFITSIYPGTTSGLLWGTAASRDKIIGDGGNHYIAISTSGTEAMRIVSTGNVGIGTTAPTQKLHVGSYQDSGRIGISGSSTSLYLGSALSGEGDSRINYERTTGSLQFSLGTNPTYTEYMRLTATGRLGIGTTAPARTLDVRGSQVIYNDLANFGSGQLLVAGATSSTKQAWFGVDTTDDVGVLQSYIQGTGAIPFALQPNGGNVGIGTIYPSGTLHIQNASQAGLYLTKTGVAASSIYNDGNLHIEGSGSNSWINQTSAANLLLNGGGGNVGVNTSSPNAKLDVYGTISGTTVSGTNHYGQYASFTTLYVNGVAVTGGSGSSADRIISASANVVAGNGGTVSFTTGGVSGTAYIDTAGRFVAAGVSTTGGISGTTGYFSGNAGMTYTSLDAALTVSGTISTTILHLAEADGTGSGRIVFGDGQTFMQGDTSKYAFNANNRTIMMVYGTGLTVDRGWNTPQTLLDVSGTIRLADSGEACDANRQGAIKYTSSEFYVCRNGSSWESLTSIASAASTDRIVSASANVVAGNGGTVSFTTGGVSGTAYIDTAGRFVGAGVSTTGGISGTSGYFSGSVGVGRLAAANVQLEIAGIARVLSNTQGLGFAVGNGAYTVAQLVGSSASNDAGVLNLRSANSILVHMSAGDANYITGNNFGLGTTTPAYTLDVSGSARLISNYVGGNGPMFLLVNSSGATPGAFGPSIVISNSVAGQHGYLVGQRQSSSGYFSVSNPGSPYNDYLVINQSGQVGISTSSPNAALEVNGTISATALTVNGVAVSGAGGDNITSSTTKVTANSVGTISFTTNGTVSSYIDSSGRHIMPGISVTTNQTSVTSLYASGNVGIGTSMTALPLTIHALIPTVQIQTPGNASTYQTSFNLVTLADGSGLGSASNRGWNFYARGNAYSPAAQQNDLGLSYWNGSTWNTALTADSVTGDLTAGTKIGIAVAPSYTLTMGTVSTGLQFNASGYNSTHELDFYVGGNKAAFMTSVNGGYLVANYLAGAYNSTVGASINAVNASNSISRIAGNKGDTGGLQLYSTGALSWGPSGDALSTAPDTGLSRGAAGSIYVGNGTQGDTSGKLVAAGISVTTNQTSVTSLYVSGNIGVGTSSIYSPAGYGVATFNGSAGSILNLRANGTDYIWLQTVTGQASYLASGPSGIPLVFKVSNTERVRIDPSGNVGISTTMPNAKLDVYGVISGTTVSGTNLYGQYASFTTLTVGGAAVTGGTPTVDNITSSTTKVTANSVGTISFTTNGTVTSYMDSSGRLIVSGISATTNQTSVTSLYASGYVGIGTTSPLSRFHVHLAADQNILFSINTNGTYSGVAGLVSLNDANSAYTPLGFYASSYYFGNGNVGIGITAPVNTLDVSGTIRAKGTTQYSGFTVDNASYTAAQLIGSSATNDAGLLVLSNAGSQKVWVTASGNTYLNGGNVGISTTTPNAKLDVNGTVSASTLYSAGTVKMGKYSSQPVACAAGYDGYTALTSQYTTCVCNGGTSTWVRTSDGSTACTW